MNDMNNVMVSGASGFVAYSLLPLLVAAGHKRLILVDKRPISANLELLLINLGADMQAYVSDRLPSSSVINDVSHIICLAGMTSVDAALSQPVQAINDNFQIAVNLAEWARCSRHSVRVVYMSSDEVLGESFSPLDESSSLRPTQPYAASKASAEIVLHSYRDVYDLDLITVRSCNLVGPNQQEPKLLPVVVRCLLTNEPIPVHGSGEQLREWMDVQDFCRAIIRVLDLDVPKGIYHACSGVHYSVNSIIRVAARTLNESAHVIHVADRLVQDGCYAMTANRLDALGWRMRIDPGQAIRNAVITLAQSFAAQLTPTRNPAVLNTTITSTQSNLSERNYDQ